MEYKNFNILIPFKTFYNLSKNKSFEIKNNTHMFYIKENINVRFDINELCKIRKNYNNNFKKFTFCCKILNNFLPVEISRYILLYEIIPFNNKKIIPFYNKIYNKIDYKRIWYILISNILFTIKSNYHLKVINICNSITYSKKFDNDIDVIFNYLGFIPNLIIDGILFSDINICNENILLACSNYKIFITKIIKPTYELLINCNHLSLNYVN
tara:strand:+ start:4500 stop:5135 length:636 start_codon:yes stop_codon:yes gene_type:complete